MSAIGALISAPRHTHASASRSCPLTNSQIPISPKNSIRPSLCGVAASSHSSSGFHSKEVRAPARLSGAARQPIGNLVDHRPAREVRENGDQLVDQQAVQQVGARRSASVPLSATHTGPYCEGSSA